MGLKSNNGGLIWEAGIDTGRLERDQKKIQSIFGELTKEGIAQEKKLLQGLSDNYKIVYSQGRKSFNSLNASEQKNIDTFTKLNLELRKVSDAQRVLDLQFRNGSISLKQYQSGTNGLTATTNKLNGELSKLQRNTSGSIKQSRIFNEVLATTAGIFSITQGTRLIGDIIRTRGEIEQLEVAFTTMLRSKQAADDLMREIVDIAVATPFKLTEVASATKQLLAYGFAQNEIKGELISIGNIASGVGASFGDIAYAYGTLKAQGRAYAYDIRQFTGRGIPIVQELANVMNTTTENVQALVEAGKVGFPEVQKAFQNLTGAGGQFFNLMEKQSQTVTGEIAKLQDRIQLMYNEIGQSNEGVVKDAISGLSFLVEHYKDVAEIIATLVITYGSYRAALILTAATQTALGTSTIVLGRYMVSIRNILNSLKAAFVTSPLAAYTAAITVLAGVVYSLSQTMNTAKSIQDEYNEAMNAGEEAANKQSESISKLVRVIESETSRRLQKEDAIRQLRTIMPEVLKGYSDEEILAGRATEAINGNTEALKKNVAAAKATEQHNELGKAIQELESKGVDAIGTWRRYGEVLRNTFDPTRGVNLSLGEWWASFVGGDKANEIIVDQAISDLKKRREALNEAFNIGDDGGFSDGVREQERNVSTAFKELLGNVSGYFDTLVALVGNKGDADKIKEGLEEVLESLAPNDPQIGKVKSQLQKINQVLETYSLKNENKEIRDVTAERKKILDDLNKLEDKAYKKSFDKREQEKADLKRQLDELRQLAKDAGFGAGVLTRIDNLELNATGNIDYRNDTEKLKEEFEKRKKLYEDYENHVRDFGVSSAENRYRSELDIAKNYLGTIQDEYTNLLAISASQTLSGGSLTGVQSERLRAFKEILDAEKREQTAQLDALLKANQSFEQQRTTLLENQAIERKKIQETGDFEALATFERNAKKEIDDLNEITAKKLTGFTEFFDGIRLMSRKAAYQGIDVLKKKIQDLIDKGLLDGKIGAGWIADLDEAAYSIGTEIPQEMQKWAFAMNSIAQSVSEVNSGLGDMFGTIGNIVGELANVQLGFNDLLAAQQTSNKTDDFTSKTNLYATAINSVVKLTGMVINASKQRRQADEKYYKSVIGYQQDYNLALVEQLRIQSETNGSVFLTDYKSQLEDGYASLTEASKGYQDALKELGRVQVKTGTDKYFDLKTAAGATGIGAVGGAAIGALGAAATGAIIGSSVPIVGTLIGAAVGLVVGIFAAKKKKNTYGSLLEEFPDLITQSADGLMVVNKELAKSLLANDLIREGGKELVENVLEWGEAVEAAREQITETIGELVGQVGNDLRNALVDAFRNGTDAGLAMTSTVGKAIEGLISNLLFSAFFSDLFKTYQDELVKSLDPISGDQNVIDDTERLLGGLEKGLPGFFDSLEAIQKMSEERGIPLFQPDSAGGTQQTGLAGAIRRELTEATGSELAGLFRGFYDLTKIGNNVSYEHLAVANSQLSATMAIQTNTAQTVTELQLAVVELRTIAKNTKPGQSDRGLGVGS